MSRYIDADAILKDIKNLIMSRGKIGAYDVGLSDAYNLVKQAEAIEIPTIVKCDECIYKWSGVCKQRVHHETYNIIENTITVEPKQVTFCSEGKKI